MRIAFIVEGPSDKIVLQSQLPWFSGLGLQVEFTPVGGKTRMCKKAASFHKTQTIRGMQKAIFLPDQNADRCAKVTRQKVGMDDCPCALTVVLKKELEAWLLADGEAVTGATGKHYRPAGQTDFIRHPKQELTRKFARALGYNPTEVEMASEMSRYFSITRAANYNTSAKRFLDVLSRLASR